MRIDNNIAKFSLIYLIANLFLLLNIQGIYWDDWVIYHQDFDVIENIFNQAVGNLNPITYIHYFLSNIGNGVFPYRLVTFFAYFFSSLFLYFILRDIHFISKKNALFITIFFSVLPVNNVRVALINVPSGLLLSLFFCSFWFLTLYINNKKTLSLRVFILSLFFFSFFINSLLLFYSIVLLYILYKEYMPFKGNIYFLPKQILKKYPDFILLPFVFFYVKTIFFIPNGLYVGYNSLNTTDLVANLQESFITAFFEPLREAFLFAYTHSILLAGCTLALWFYFRNNEDGSKEELKISLSFILLGLIFFIFAVFPYAAVGKIPRLDGFYSRHMLLIPLGVSLTLYGLILLIARFNTGSAKLCLYLLISIFVLKTAYDQFLFLKDWFYQVALEENYRNNNTMRENSTFIFRTDIPLANHRTIQFHEHNGMFRQIFGSSTRYMAQSVKFLQIYRKYNSYAEYNFVDWKESYPIIFVHAQKSSPVLSHKLFASLLYSMFTNEAVFRYKAKNLVHVSTFKTTPETIL
ncbi:hypothetical protein [Legionella hackeliae]|uniref:Glycosyltransferase RgtA/B/C/D-like domain-containing protein n=1 Tax=Legionella hackeliae TaxID=449 RepID=A0A0A8UT27_LEGHA|nr:hypothetical protein [Legionella hackeliae]KTD08809.1 hypothetical protein Lhac_3032 [Legionella hackeliae]CEK10237.1 membrane protein of unknown function [Legionella hackeliae]STX46966.1 Uncharacterised protein [Legionella hackeliae]